MEYLFEFIAELLLEGSLEISKNKKGFLLKNTNVLYVGKRRRFRMCMTILQFL